MSATSSRSKASGFAMVTSLIFLVIIVGIVGIATTISFTNRRLSANNVQTLQAQLAAEAGVEKVIYETWHQTLGQELASKPADYKASLQSFKTLLNAYQGTSATTGASTNFANGVSLRFTGTIDGGAAFNTTVKRTDAGDSIVLNVVSTGKVGSASRRIQQTLSVQGSPYKGSLFALLSNNVNCIFCHTRVTSIEAGYNADGSLAALSSSVNAINASVKDTQRVRVGVLENLTLDQDGKDSLVTGTIYTRGTSSLTSSSALKTMGFSNNADTLTNTVKSFTPQNCGAAPCTALGNSYSNYPNSNYPDGELPDSFPLPIPDTNSNKQIDNAEWEDAIANDSSPGTLSGGDIKLVSTTVTETVVSGKTVRTITPDPTRTQQDKTIVSSNDSTTRGVAGNLILKSTPGSPLTIDGTLYVDGDVVIQGSIAGNGKIIARGNIYVTGDVKYACGTPAGSSPCNYSQPQTLPQFGLIAGGNTMLGPYMNVSTGSSLTDVTNKDLLDLGNDGNTSFSMGEAALFNYKEYIKAQANPSYIPRFYRLRPEVPVWRCEVSTCRKPGYNDLTPIDAASDPAIFARAVIVDMSPTANWLAPETSTDTRDSELAVKTFWRDAVETNASRPAGALQMDGILYSSNAVFTIAPKASKIAGQITLNGSLIAADTGVLSPAGLRIHYDQRLASLLQLRTDLNLALVRSAFTHCKLSDTDCENN